ncbi:D-Ala-D-Ala carboxypeptidase family metallohydrolase [Dyella acidiphila]|uniref:Peptidase M15A C-terminal domain-containing protein n=1 Tax=Dyella acidiphila TaxID=2775866 RepID=A0ABR9GDH1_9GAMM|nr:D-Ala-D-Ala carboxypeptidase family metallohydrolase [Dyella acidiphila]MBE1162074.1 hypothetical protein [Dyella acidiphila]
MSIVLYGRFRVSDPRLRDVLECMADALSRTVRITSGDRDFVPRGGALNSLHRSNEAIDFHVDGLADEQAFQLLRSKRREVFGSDTGNAFRYQIIRHGPYTETQGPHLHLGYAPPGIQNIRRGFMVEGLVRGQRYTVVENP